MGADAGAWPGPAAGPGAGAGAMLGIPAGVGPDPQAPASLMPRDLTRPDCGQLGLEVLQEYWLGL